MLNKIIKLRQGGMSTYQIASNLETSRSNVSRYLRKNGYGAYKLEEISFDNSETSEDILGEFLGVFAADGHYYKSVYRGGHKYVIRIYVSGDEVGYARSLKMILKKLFNKKPFLYKEKKRNVFVIKYNSRKLIDIIREYLIWTDKKTYSVQLKKLDHSNTFLKGFIRGFFDCDGYMDKSKGTIYIGCTSKKIIKQFNEILLKNGFNPKIRTKNDKRPNRRSIYVLTLPKNETAKFISFVTPRNQKRRL